MKNNILQIVEEALNHPTLLDHTTYSLTVNYITDKKNLIFRKSVYEKIKKELAERGEILNYNFTITMRVPDEIKWESKSPDNWRTVNFIFHGSQEDPNVVDFSYFGDNGIDPDLYHKLGRFGKKTFIKQQSYDIKDIQMVILFLIEMYNAIYANSLRLNKTFNYFTKFFKDTVLEE